MKRRAVALWTFGAYLSVSLSAAGCEPRDKTPVGRGSRIFQRTCASCHGADGRGIMRVGLVRPPRDLTRAEFHAQFTDDQLRSVIRTGKGQMPAFGGLVGDEDLSNVIAFIRTLPPGSKPPAPPQAPSSTLVPVQAPEEGSAKGQGSGVR